MIKLIPAFLMPNWLNNRPSGGMLRDLVAMAPELGPINNQDIRQVNLRTEDGILVSPDIGVNVSGYKEDDSACKLYQDGFLDGFENACKMVSGVTRLDLRKMDDVITMARVQAAKAEEAAKKAPAGSPPVMAPQASPGAA